MKNIKELGLEVIELEDQVLLNIEKQVLLIDPNETPQEGDWIYWNKLIVKSIDTAYSKDTKYIVASTKPLEGLPLLVIEDEIEDLAEDHTNIRILQHKTSIQVARQYFDGFKEGYNKAKETYKFTEKDLRKAISMARETLEWDEKWGWFTTKTEDEIIESITKKELWIEVEDYCGSPYTTERCPKCVDSCDRAYQRPKITEGKIKAVWK